MAKTKAFSLQFSLLFHKSALRFKSLSPVWSVTKASLTTLQPSKVHCPRLRPIPWLTHLPCAEHPDPPVGTQGHTNEEGGQEPMHCLFISET
jgi:hypothetical protein